MACLQPPFSQLLAEENAELEADGGAEAEAEVEAEGQAEAETQANPRSNYASYAIIDELHDAPASVVRAHANGAFRTLPVKNCDDETISG